MKKLLIILLLLFPVHGAWAKDFEFFGEVGNSIYETHLMNLELDNINLLYVALTRAQDELHIICSNSINNKGEENLKKYSGMFINYLKKNLSVKIHIEGHTDNVGSAQNNLVLSKKRAEAVKNFMISKTIGSERLNVLYFGETVPVADNSTKEGRQKNRRVEMTIIFE